MTELWNLSGLIIEGICGSGKTTVLQALLRSEVFSQRSYLSALILSEHHTQRVLERKEREQGLAVEDNLALLDQHVSYLEALDRRLDPMPWRESNRTNMRIPYLLERFHLTHVCHYDHMRWEHVEPLDRRLARLNAKLCLLTIDESALHSRIIAGRNAEWRDYLRRYGETDEQILAHCAAQQRRFLDLCEKTTLPVLILDTSCAPVEAMIREITRFWDFS